MGESISEVWSVKSRYYRNVRCCICNGEKGELNGMFDFISPIYGLTENPWLL